MEINDVGRASLGEHAAGSRTMFFEVASRGHRLDYIQRLLGAIAEREVLGSIVFVLGPDFSQALDDELLASAQRSSDVEVIYMTDREMRRCRSKGGLRRRLNTYLTFERYFKATGADLGFVNYLDTVLFGMALTPFARSKKAVAGILFRPTVHYPSLGMASLEGVSFCERSREWFSLKGHDMIYRTGLKSPRVKTILSLDPLFPEFARTQYSGGHKVQILPEPYSAETPESLDLPRGDRTTFLLFGSISRRKGLLETLDALVHLTPEEVSRVRLVVAGRLADDIRVSAADRIDRVRRVHPRLELDIRNRYIPDNELKTLVKKCDVILAPYLRHVGSSGTLVWAAHYRRPVISQRYGLMGALVKRHGLGLACDPEDSIALAECIRRGIREGPEALADPSGMAEYAAANDSGPFINTIFEAAEVSFRSSPTGKSRKAQSPCE